MYSEEYLSKEDILNLRAQHKRKRLAYGRLSLVAGIGIGIGCAAYHGSLPANNAFAIVFNFAAYSASLTALAVAAVNFTIAKGHHKGRFDFYYKAPIEGTLTNKICISMDL